MLPGSKYKPDASTGSGFEKADRTMAYITARSAQGSSWNGWLASLLAGRKSARKAPLDVRTLPDHLKRDMGLLDGNDPAGRHC